MRRILVAVCAVAVGAGGLVAAGMTSASAAKPVVTAVGTVTCTGGTGKAKITPPFKQVPQPGQRVTTSKFKTNCTGTTGNPAVTPISAKITATSTSPDATAVCTGLTTAQESLTITEVDIKWKASGGKINPTHITFTSLNAGVPTGGFTNPGPSGVSVVSGSYLGNDAVSVVMVDPSTVGSLIATCTNPKDKGVKKLSFGGGGGSLNITP